MQLGACCFNTKKRGVETQGEERSRIFRMPIIVQQDATIYSLVWIRNQLDVTLCYPLFLLYNLLNMFRATMCPSSGSDDCVVLSPRVGVVAWLHEGCQNRLAGSVFIEEFVAQQSCATNTITLRSRQLLKMGTWLPETC